MKNKLQQFFWSTIILALVAGMSGCVKGGATVNVSPISYISIINEAPYSPAADIYFNGTLVTSAGGIAPGRFSNTYGQLKPGKYVVDFKKAGTDSVMAEIPSTDFDTSAFSTIVLYNLAADSSQLQAARIIDDFSQVTTGYAYYRFFNLSPDVPAASLFLNNASQQTNRAPADNITTSAAYDAFQSVSAADYTVQIRNSNSDSVLCTALNVQLSTGYGYTIFLGGTAKTGYVANVLQAVF